MPDYSQVIMELTRKYALSSITIFFGCAAALMIIINFWQWYDDWQLTKPLPIHTLTVSTSSATALLSPIQQGHLFGQTLSGNVPLSSLQLRVVGIFVVENHPGLSRASIASAEQPAKIYRTGDKMPSGITVYAITPQAVILQNDGQLEKLPLAREQLQFKTRTKEEIP